MAKAKQEQTERIKTSMELRRELWAKVRAQAVNERRPALAIVEDALDLYLKQQKGAR